MTFDDALRQLQPLLDRRGFAFVGRRDGPMSSGLADFSHPAFHLRLLQDRGYFDLKVSPAFAPDTRHILEFVRAWLEKKPKHAYDAIDHPDPDQVTLAMFDWLDRHFDTIAALHSREGYPAFVADFLPWLRRP